MIDVIRALFPSLLVILVAVLLIHYVKKESEKGKIRKDKNIVLGMSLGLCLGAGLGMVFKDQLALCMSLGMIFGMSVGINIKKDGKDEKGRKMDLVLIDCQNDFVDGSLAAPNGFETVEKIRDFLDNRKDPIRVFYSADWHPENHMSFDKEGGSWPAHCIEGTFGAEIHKTLQESPFPSHDDHLYFKGRDPKREEYSAFEAKNKDGRLLKEVISDEIYLAGIASEYCVRETALAFHDFGKKVYVIKDLLGYINKDGHENNLKDLQEKGIEVI